jgi:hypothetical protein
VLAAWAARDAEQLEAAELETAAAEVA